MSSLSVWIKKIVPAAEDRHLETLSHLYALASGHCHLLKWPEQSLDQEVERARISQAIRGVLGENTPINQIHPLSLEPDSLLQRKSYMSDEAYHKIYATVIHHTCLVDLWNSFGEQLHAQYFPRFRSLLTSTHVEELERMATSMLPLQVLMRAFGFQNAPWLTLYTTACILAGALLASEKDIAEKFSDLAELLSERIVLGSLKEPGREGEWVVLYR